MRLATNTLFLREGVLIMAYRFIFGRSFTAPSIASGAILLAMAVSGGRQLQAQQEVYHPGETYNSLQAGYDAYLDAEAERRAQIGRQIMIQEQIMATNTWADPADRYRPVHPESYGTIRPRFYTGATLSDVYGGSSVVGATIVGYRGAAGTIYTGKGSAWPRVPGDIYGTPYYGFARQPIGHIKIWTGPQSYIYKPVYANAPMAEPISAQPRPDLVRPRRVEAARPATRPLPPPPQPSDTTPAGPQAL